MKSICLSFFRDKSKITASLRHTATLLKENQSALLNSGTVLEEDQIQLQKENEKLIKYIKERHFNTVSQTVHSN